MKIYYFSDLHLEFMNSNELNEFINKMTDIQVENNSVCILAGDIGHPQEPHYDLFFSFVQKHFPKTFVITGNHEYYTNKSTIEETNLFLEKYFKQFQNITLLNNSFEIYNNYCFIGSVLWTHIYDTSRTINDINYIPDFNIEKYNVLNRVCIDFLQKAIQSNENCIVITHHMPSETLIHSKYKTDVLRPYNQWFYCNVENLFICEKVKAWIYGHTHTASKNIIKKIPLFCNPYGYPYEDTGFDFEAHFIVD